MSALLAVLLAVALPLRNPFWPIGHNGVREPITDELKVVSAPEPTAAEEETRTSVTPEMIAAAKISEISDEERENRLWITARKTLKIGGIMKTGGGRQAVSINGRIYADGDLISENYEDHRFTWRVQGLTEGATLRLKRIRIRTIETDAAEKGANP